MPQDDFHALEAAELAADRIVALIDANPRRILHKAQLRDSAQGVPANIAEGLGRRGRDDRLYKFGVARAEAKETIAHLLSNHHAGRISKSEFEPVKNLLRVVIKMLNRNIDKG